MKIGFLYGLISSAAFGLIPLFTLPLLKAGITAQTALVYRFIIASIILWPLLFFKGERFLIQGIDFVKLMILSAFYLGAVFLFFQGFFYLPSGIVATVNFLYPVMVMLIMILFFHETFQLYTCIAILLAIIGVSFLSIDQKPETSSQIIISTSSLDIIYGIVITLLAALCNAFYMVGIQVARIPNISGLIMTFYVLLFGSFYSLIYAFFSGTLQWLCSIDDFINAFLLALVTAVISNLTLIVSIKRIGSTLVSILGVMEPLTAVIIGIFVFNEPFNYIIFTGIIFIILSVCIVMLWPHFIKSNK